MRAVISVAAACLSVVGLSVAADVQASVKKTVSIPAGGLGPALQALAAERKIHIVFISEDVRELRTEGVSGEFTIEEALERILDGTDLIYEYIDEETVSILPMPPATAGDIPRRPAASHRENRRYANRAFMSVLAAFGAATGVVSNAHGQSSNEMSSPPVLDDTALLDTVTVTGARIEKRVQDVATSISIVNERELAEQLQVSTDVLAVLNVTVPGLNVSRGDRIGCGMNIRGRPANFQVNGVPVNQELSPSYCNGMYQVSPFALERIEVVRGATALYGAGAPGGVVNMITRRPGKAEVEIDGAFRVSAPTHGSGAQDYDAYLGAGQQLDGWDYYAGVAYQDIDETYTPRGGYAPVEELTSWGLNGTLGREFGEGRRLRLTGTFYREQRGQQYGPDGTQSVGSFGPVVAIPSNPYKHDGFDKLLTLIASYDQDEFLGHHLSLSAYLLRKEDLHFSNFYNAGYGNFFFNLNTDVDKQGLRSTLARKFDLGGRELALEYGLDYVRDSMYEVELNSADRDDVHGFFVPETELDTTSGFAQADLVLGKLRLSGGVRYERYRGEIGDRKYDPTIPFAALPGDIGKSDIWLYNLGGVFDLTEGLQLYGGYSQGAALARLGRAARGTQNPGGLTPEPAISEQYELGLRGRVGPVDLSLAVFYSESSKGTLLEPDPTCASSEDPEVLRLCTRIPVRSPQRFKGFEATLDWPINAVFATGAIVTYQRGEVYNQAFGRYIDYSSDTVSPGRATVYVTLEPVTGWRTRLQGTYFDKADYYTHSEQALGFINTDSTFLTELTSTYVLGPGELTFSVSNLFDREYIDVKSQAWGDFAYTLEEGRRISLGYRIRY